MNKFVETPIEQPPYSWAEMRINKGIYIWDAVVDEPRSNVALFVSNGQGDVVIFHQKQTGTTNGRQFNVASEGTWDNSKFIKLSGKPTCEIVS